jgi:hypothetical protein
MKKIIALSLVLVLLSALIPERARSSSAADDQPPPATNLQEAQTERLYLPLLTATFPDRSIFGGEFVSSSTGLTQMKDAGIYWARLNTISWAAIEPTPGARDWSSLAAFEQMAIDMHTRGLEVIAIIRETPSWAQAVPGVVCGPIQDEDIPAFANFVRDVVAKYSQAPYFVRHWEIQNEEDVPINTQTTVFGCWGDPSDLYYGGRYYAKVIQQVYPAIKAADPQSRVILGGLLVDCDPNNPPQVNGQTKDCTSAKYLEGVLVGGGGNYFDAVSFHAYDYYNNIPGSFGNFNFGASEANHTVLTYKAAFLKSVLNKYGYGNKPLLNTEVALLCMNACDSNFEMTKAYYLTRAYADALKADLQANVWYTVAPNWRNTSLLASDGSPTPALEAYEFAHKMMSDSTSLSDIAPNATVRGYEIHSPGQRVWLLWTAVGETSSLNLPSMPRGIYDALGNPLGTSQTITVDYKPVYVVLNP